MLKSFLDMPVIWTDFENLVSPNNKIWSRNINFLSVRIKFCQSNPSVWHFSTSLCNGCENVLNCRMSRFWPRNAGSVWHKSTKSGLKIDNKDMNNFQACSLSIFPKSSDLSWNRLFEFPALFKPCCVFEYYRNFDDLYIGCEGLWLVVSTYWGLVPQGWRVNYLLFSYPGGDGRGVRTVQMARLRILRQSRLKHTIKPCGDGRITEIRCKNIFNRHISL